MNKRWVGAPRKLCHTCSYEVSKSGVDATKDFSNKPILMIGIRDCRVKSKTPKILSKDETSVLISKIAGDPESAYSNLNDPLTIRELPAGFEQLGK